MKEETVKILPHENCNIIFLVIHFLKWNSLDFK